MVIIILSVTINYLTLLVERNFIFRLRPTGIGYIISSIIIEFYSMTYYSIRASHMTIMLGSRPGTMIYENCALGSWTRFEFQNLTYFYEWDKNIFSLDIRSVVVAIADGFPLNLPKEMHNIFLIWGLISPQNLDSGAPRSTLKNALFSYSL